MSSSASRFGQQTRNKSNYYSTSSSNPRSNNTCASRLGQQTRNKRNYYEYNTNISNPGSNNKNNSSNTSKSSSSTSSNSKLLWGSILALLSYIPFEYVAKVALIASATLFVIDPVPPVTRLISIGTAAIVFLLARVERLWRDYHHYYYYSNYDDDDDDEDQHEHSNYDEHSYYSFCCQQKGISSHKSKSY